MIEAPRRTKVEQREATTRTLLAVARDVFARQGYARASTEEIVRRANVTRGALYHHFGSKEGLFAAVVEDVQRDVARRIETAAGRTDDGWEQLLDGCRAFLATSTDPHMQRIMLVDAPAVLGWEAWRRMDAEHSMKLLTGLLDRLVAAGVIAPLPVAALAHLLAGAMNEAALWIARSEVPDQALDEAAGTLERLLGALPGANGPRQGGRSDGKGPFARGARSVRERPAS